MRLTIELTPQQGAALSVLAARRGIEDAELAQAIVAERLPEIDAPTQTETAPQAGNPTIDAENAAAIALLEFWMAQDATDDPEEIRKADEEFEELKRNLNTNRAATGERLVFP